MRSIPSCTAKYCNALGRRRDRCYRETSTALLRGGGTTRGWCRTSYARRCTNAVVERHDVSLRPGRGVDCLRDSPSPPPSFVGLTALNLSCAAKAHVPKP